VNGLTTATATVPRTASPLTACSSIAPVRAPASSQALQAYLTPALSFDLAVMHILSYDRFCRHQVVNIGCQLAETGVTLGSADRRYTEDSC